MDRVLWIAAVARALVLVTMRSKRQDVCVAHVEIQTVSVHVIKEVWVSGAGEKFHVSKSCYGLRHAVRVYRKAACECCAKMIVLETDDECIGCEQGTQDEEARLTEPSFRNVCWCCVCVHAPSML